MRYPMAHTAETPQHDSARRSVPPTAAVRAGIDITTESAHRRQIDQARTEGYQRIPPTAIEVPSMVTSLRYAITEEPW